MLYFRAEGKVKGIRGDLQGFFIAIRGTIHHQDGASTPKHGLRLSETRTVGAVRVRQLIPEALPLTCFHLSWNFKVTALQKEHEMQTHRGYPSVAGAWGSWEADGVVCRMFIGKDSGDQKWRGLGGVSATLGGLWNWNSLSELSPFGPKCRPLYLRQ